MGATVTEPALKLSICITTFNRAAFIGATLESVLVQATDECEVVVLDGGSTDQTEQVISEYVRRFHRLRYIRQDRNNGFDRDCDRVVELARGEYCWLMTDDDLLKPGAIAAVLRALRPDLSLIVINTEARDFDTKKVLQSRWLDVESDRVYGPEEMDRLVLDTGDSLRFIGCIVIRRAIWVAREKKEYFGSLFIHLGVIFQDRLPGGALVIAEPLIVYRMGNTHTYSPKMFETFAISLPSVVWALPLSEVAKNKIHLEQPWRSLQELLFYRAVGAYSLSEYRQWIRPRLRSRLEAVTPAFTAIIPGSLINIIFVLYYALTRRRFKGVWEPALMLQVLEGSRFHIRNLRLFRLWRPAGVASAGE